MNFVNNFKINDCTYFYIYVNLAFMASNSFCSKRARPTEDSNKKYIRYLLI
jgi:hypothetical protein